MVMFENIEEIFKEIRDFNDCARALVTLATAIGTIIVFYYSIWFIWELIQGCRLYICKQMCCKTNFVKKYGKWAVISGATDGIGLSLAKELAKRGMSIIIIGRNEEKLERCKSMLEEEENVGEVLTVKIDLSDSSLENFDSIRDKIDPENRDIGVLINNAGLFNDKFQRFNTNDMKFIRELVNVNVLAVLHLTRMIMPGMVSRGKGLVVNVSSSMGNISSPYSNAYGSTKKFVNTFSNALQTEYSGHPIEIVNLTPGPVFTKLMERTGAIKKPSFINPIADDYAKVAINAISTGVSELSGTMVHGIIDKSARLFEFFGLIPIVFRTMLWIMPDAAYIPPLEKNPKKIYSAQESNNEEVFNSRTIET